jgi:two-component system chemotaxis response regulator CheB
MIKILIVDDSALMRAFLARLVEAQPDMEVAAVAADPLIAIEQIRLRSPDVITLDVEMPRMNGIEFLRKLMSVRPLPVVMISSLTQDGAQTTLHALELGAVEFVAKPADLAQFEASAAEIADKIRAAALARLRRRAAAPLASALPALATPPAPAPPPVGSKRCAKCCPCYRRACRRSWSRSTCLPATPRLSRGGWIRSAGST